MSNRNRKATQEISSRIGMCLLGAAAFLLPAATAADSKPLPEVIRGIPGTPASNTLQLAYQASFPNGSFGSSVDKLNIGPMVPGDTGIPGTSPITTPLPGEMLVSIHRPVDLSPDVIPAESIWATPVEFGPGSVFRARATFVAPVGPLPGGGFAMGLIAKVGDEDDIQTEPKIGVTVNVRPGFLVRFGASFGNAEPARVVLPDDVKNAIFSTTDPVPFTIELTVDRAVSPAKATGKLTVGDQVFSVPFVLSEFLADSGPVVTTIGPGIAVNSNGPGQTASVHIRDFRIYAKVGG